MNFRRFYKLARFGAMVLSGRQLLDPIEVFYLPRDGAVYPINSKAGCSTVKLLLIQRFAPDYGSAFPEIHFVDPSPLTDGQVRRLFFDTVGEYSRFCRDKEIVLVTRDPYRKFYSCYLDNQSGKNPLYDTYARLRRVFGFDNSLTLPRFLQRCAFIPDVFADRHFRSQSFYLPATAKKLARGTRLMDISTFADAVAAKTASAPIKLNTSRDATPDERLAFLRQSIHFRKRYNKDIKLLSSR